MDTARYFPSSVRRSVRPVSGDGRIKAPIPGLIARINGRAYFLHATSDRDKGRMTIIDRPISDYLNGSSSHAGIVICRPYDLPPSRLWEQQVVRR